MPGIFLFLILSFATSLHAEFSEIGSEHSGVADALGLVLRAVDRSVGIIGSSRDISIDRLLEAHVKPVIVGNFERFDDRKSDCELLVIFIAANDSTSALKAKIASRKNFEVKFLIVLETNRYLDLKETFRWLLDKQILNINVMTNNGYGFASFYSFMPFSSDGCESAEPVLVNQIKDGKFVKDIATLFPRKTANLNKCPVRIATSGISEPYVFIETFKNKTIINPIKASGRDINLLKTLAEVLNFELEITHVSDEGALYRNGSAVGPFLMLLENKADLIVADYWLQIFRLEFVDSSVPYISQKIALMIPPGSQLNSFEKFILPLDTLTWAFMLSIFAIGLMTILLIQGFKSEKWMAFVFGAGVTRPSLNLIGAIFGQSQKSSPKLNFARFLLMIFLIYCLVMRTLYAGSLYGFLRSSIYHREVQSIDDMITRDFKIFYLESTREFFSSPPQKLEKR